MKNGYRYVVMPAGLYTETEGVLRYDTGEITGKDSMQGRAGRNILQSREIIFWK